MAKRKRKITTNSKELYEKLSMLNFSSEVLLKEVKPVQVKKILGNINKKMEVLGMEKVGKYILIKKKNPINFNVYFSGRPK